MDELVLPPADPALPPKKQPWVAYALLAILVPALQHLYRDYRSFLALGPGGTPKTVLGYIRVKFLSFFALRNPYEPGPTPAHLLGSTGHLRVLPRRIGPRPETKGIAPLRVLPRRIGPRPETKGIAPHRQITQRAKTDDYRLLESEIKRFGHGNQWLKIGTSCFEKYSTGLFARNPTRTTCLGEVCHAHPSEGSMHMTLHPEDARIVLKAGWGERHPLARGGWFEQFVPAGFMMIYAPQSTEDVETLMEIVEAAAWYVSGRDAVSRRSDERHDSGNEMSDIGLSEQEREM